MNEYTKKLILEVQVDKTEMQKIERQFDDLTLSHIISPEAYEEFKQRFVDMQTRMKKIEDLKESISEIKMFGGEDAKKALKEMTEELEKLQAEAEEAQEGSLENEESGEGKSKLSQAGDYIKQAFGKDGAIGKKLISGFESVMNSIKDGIKDIIESAINEFKEMASYDLANTTQYNAEAWNTTMTYGLTGADAYAFNKAKETIGVSSDDEFYQAMMSPALQNSFKEYFKQYQKEYEENKEMALKTQEFYKEWEDFKRDMMYEVMDFFTENKDTIMSVMKAAMNFFEAILSLVGWIADALGVQERSESQRAAATADIINNYKGGNTNTNNTSVKIDNTFNGVAQQDKSWLQNAGNMTYEQVIKALT